MPRLGLSYAAVKDAAERLEAQGLTPTVMRIRDEVGGTGSMSTIARHLKEWRQASGQVLSVSGVLAHSPFGPHQASSSSEGDAVPAEVGQIARSAWQRLADLAGQEVAQAQAACAADKQATVEQAQQQVAEALEQSKKREDEAAHRVEMAQAARAESHARAQQERLERVQAQQSHSAQIEQLNDKCSALTAQVAAAQARVDELQKRLSTSEIGRHKAEEARELAIERQRSSEAQSQARMDKAAHVDQQRLASVTQSFERLVSSLRQDEAKARTSVARHQQENVTLKERLTGQESALVDVRKQLREANETSHRIQQTVKETDKRCGELCQQIHRLQEEKKSQSHMQSAMASLAHSIQQIEKRLS